VLIITKEFSLRTANQIDNYSIFSRMATRFRMKLSICSLVGVIYRWPLDYM